MPHFNDEPCPHCRAQSTAELAAEVVRLKEELEKTDLIAMTSFEMAAAVAKLAGVPEIVLARARALLAELEGGGTLPSGAQALAGKADIPQLPLFGERAAPSPIEETLRAMDLERLTPIDAMLALVQLKRLLPER